ncbi:uncharacterized protein isoform X2 [Rhodnius prolixus]|uniref:uncharacterized protein isoform X2 n=1 Tax=Rhodnius prolixus TaxID=13249 RepID=UPI003D18BA0D
MKEGSWEKVIISWANALQLRETIISDISDLLDGSFFICLLKQLGHECQSDKKETERNIIESFIKDSYGGVKMKNEWDNKEVILISSLLLLTSSLDVSHLRAPLYCLDTDIQLNIQAFIQRLLTIPKKSITREIITEAIESIPTAEDREDVDSDEPSSFVSSPNSSFTTTFVSPDVKCVTMNKIKSLQRQVEILDLDKQHLQEELELNKQLLLELDVKCNAKDQEILHLRNELFLQGNHCAAEDETVQHKALHLQEMKEITSLKEDLALLQTTLNLTRIELETTLSENQDLKDNLQREKDEKAILTERYEESETKMATLLANMEEITTNLTILKQTCQEQEDQLREQGCTKVLDESGVINEESTAVLGTGESLASVVDLKYAELEEETKKLRERLTESEAMVLNLQEMLSKQEISKLKEDLSKLDLGEVENSVLEKFIEDGLQNQSLVKIKEISKLRENLQTVVISKNLHLNQLRNDVKNERLEIDRLREMLETKTVRLEECTALTDKLRRNLNENESEIKTITATLKRTLSEKEQLKTILDLNQSEVDDVRCQLEICEARLAEKEDRIAALTADIGERILEMDQLKEQNSVYEQRLLTHTLNMKNKDVELNDVRTALDACKAEVEELKNQLCMKASLIAELKHDVQMCQHEKGVLEKEMENLVKNVKKNESLRKELTKCEEELVLLKKQLEEEKVNMKLVQDQVDLEDKFNNAFDAKLAELQMKMKLQYEKELSGTIEEYKDKISQLKLKITKDKMHIQELSAELWNTTDKFLLSQQQGEALRNQLRRTKCALEILNNSAIRRHSLATSAAIQRASNPCLWLQAEENDSNTLPVFDDLLTRNGKTVTFSSLNCKSLSPEFPRRRFSLVLEASLVNDEAVRQDDDEEHEVFNDAFLQDLKDGICRLPNENHAQRASCPPVAKRPDSPIHVEKVSDKQVLIPPEKPKRKGQIAYCKPGPPTPCRSATARLSLQNFEKPEQQKKLKENNCAHFLPPTGPRRLSKLFATTKGQNKTKPTSSNQDSPKVKRKNFFQRKFGSNRENLPPA